MASGHGHSHDGVGHSHESVVDHGHTHEILDGPGSFLGREMPIVEGRDFKERAFTVGIGGYVLCWLSTLFSCHISLVPTSYAQLSSCHLCLDFQATDAVLFSFLSTLSYRLSFTPRRVYQSCYLPSISASSTAPTDHFPHPAP